MPHDYTLWLNGNSLVLMSSALSSRQVDTLLDLQLAAYLQASAEYAMFDDYTRWRSEYRNTQLDLGCPFTELAAPDKPAVSIEPFKALCCNVLNRLGHAHRAGVARCLQAVDLPEAHPALQVLWTECVLPPERDLCATLVTELRVVLPDASIVSGEMRFKSREGIERRWPWQRFDVLALEQLTLHATRYLVSERALADIRDGLREKYAQERAKYVCQVALPASGGQHHE
ncbi:hypothetical protein ACNFG0_03160 [Pseudomonas sp. NY15372]|uniref:hypothetical protein n=1 Tax=Pseudomonas sp. NY15372 TaxID=3400356 RepID=UPI003A846802